MHHTRIGVLGMLRGYLSILNKWIYPLMHANLWEGHYYANHIISLLEFFNAYSTIDERALQCLGSALSKLMIWASLFTCLDMIFLK